MIWIGSVRNISKNKIIYEIWKLWHGSNSKNRNSKRKYGLSQYDIEDYIASLEAEDLYKGPEPDRDCPGEELFIFKKEIIPNVIFYTKLKYKNNQIKILSCHEDEN